MTPKRRRILEELRRQGWVHAPGSQPANRALLRDGHALEAVDRGDAALVANVIGEHVRDAVPCPLAHKGDIVSIWCRHGAWLHLGLPRDVSSVDAQRRLFEAVDPCPLTRVIVEFHPLAAANRARLVLPSLDTIVGEYLSRDPADCHCDPELHVWRDGQEGQGTLVDPVVTHISTAHETWCEQYGQPGPGRIGLVWPDGRFTPTEGAAA